MWKLSCIAVVVSALLLGGMAQAGRDVTGPLDTVVGVPDDGDWPPNELPPFAVDDQVLTKYLHFKGGDQPTGIRVTPVVGATVVTGLTFTTANDADGRDPVTYELSGSNVSINGPYTLIAEGPIVDFAGGAAWPRRTQTTTPIQFANTVAYQHYQLLFPAIRTAGNYMQIAEIELLMDVYTATDPSPADGAVGVTLALMQWTPGDTAVMQDVYFGTSPDLGPADLKTHTGPAASIYYYPDPFIPGGTYYWRVDSVEADMTTIHTGDVWSFTAAPITAFNPVPPDGKKWVDTNVDLAWSAGVKARTHDVYFGTDETAVANGTGGTFKGNQYPKTYDPGPLAQNTTYYWRIDDVDPEGAKYPGEVWSFTTIGPGGGIKGEYFNNVDLSGMPAMTRIDPDVDFNWGADGPDESIGPDGWSARWTADLDIDIADTFTFSVNSQDGTRLWIDDELVIDMWVAWVTTEYASLPIYLERGIHSLRLEFFDGGEPGTADAVQQLYWLTPTMAKQIIPAGPLQPPLRAGTPNPPDGAVDVKQTPTLSWGPGENAAKHNVYFGTDPDAVVNADTTTAGIYRGQKNLDETSYVPTESPLDWGTAHYWRIDEVNGVDVWKGAVWSFTTANCLIVEDFEEYDDFCNRIFYKWKDGWGYSADADCGVTASTGNGTGSTVGNLEPPFAERIIVHGGAQSMPFEYNNTGAGGKARYSETSLEFAAAQDWTAHNMKGLSLWFYGETGNTPETLYVALEDSTGQVRVATHPDPGALQLAIWQAWYIDLQQFSGVNLASVKKVYLGVGNRTSPTAGGSGKLYIDDIRVCPPQCVPSMGTPAADLSGNCIVDYADVEIVADEWLNSGFTTTPVDPGTTGLVSHYPFEGNANDAVGGNNGTTSGMVSYGTGHVGQAIILDGLDDYVDTGAAPSLNITGAVTVSAWIRLAAVGSDQKIAGNHDNLGGGYKFGVFSNDVVEFEIRTSDNSAVLNRDVAGGTVLAPGVWYHVAGVYSEGNYIRTYVNGLLDREMVTTEILASSTGTLKMGCEPHTTTAALFNGRMDEVRIYNRALSGVEVVWLAGYTSPISIPADLYQDDVIDFKDFAVLGDSWLDEMLWP